MEIPLPSLAAAVVLALVYAWRGVAGQREAAEHLWARRRWISAAAGVSVAYVFVDVLPELAAQDAAIARAANEGGALLAGRGVYLLALASFVVLYGLEHIVLAGRGDDRGESRKPGYRLRLAGFAAYSALIGGLLVERAEHGLAALVVYALAMAIHFTIVNHSLVERDAEAYGRRGRWLLAASVLAGWAVAATMPLSEAAFARLFAVLAGGVVITSLRAELPDDRTGRFWPFVAGAAAFAALLLATV